MQPAEPKNTIENASESYDRLSASDKEAIKKYLATIVQDYESALEKHLGFHKEFVNARRNMMTHILDELTYKIAFLEDCCYFWDGDYTDAETCEIVKSVIVQIVSEIMLNFYDLQHGEYLHSRGFWQLKKALYEVKGSAERRFDLIKDAMYALLACNADDIPCNSPQEIESLSGSEQ